MTSSPLRVRLVLTGPASALLTGVVRELADDDVRLVTPRELDRVLRDADVVALAPAMPDAAAVAARACALEPDVAVLVLAEPAASAAVADEIRFSPYVSAHTRVVVAAGAPAVAAELRAAAQLTRARRRHQRELEAVAPALQAASPPAPGVPAERLGPLLEAAPLGVLTLDGEGTIRAASRHAGGLLGEPRPAGRRLTALVDAGDVAALEARLHARTPDPLLVRRADGAVWLRVTAGRFVDHAGRAGTVVIAQDATAEVAEARRRGQQERLQRFLAQAGAELEMSLSPEQMLGRVAGLAASELGGACVIEICDDNGTVLAPVVVAADPAVAAAIRRVRAERGAPPETVSGVLRGDPAVVVPGPEDFGCPARSAAVAPLAARGRRYGVISVLRLDGPAHEAEDLALIEALAERAAVALGNALLYERERSIAETLQRSLLPARLPRPPGLEVGAVYRAGGGGTRVGGDWYDVLSASAGRVWCAIGDVVGRGVPAAVVMSQLRTLCRAYALDAADPGQLLRAVDRAMHELAIGEFATLQILMLEPATRMLHYASAAHPPPLLLGRDGPARFLQAGRSVPLGVDPDMPRSVQTEPLAADDVLVLYTDGLVERRQESLDAGLRRLCATAAAGPREPQALARHLVDVLGASGGDDDIAVLAVRMHEPRLVDERLAHALDATRRRLLDRAQDSGSVSPADRGLLRKLIDARSRAGGRPERGPAGPTG